MYQWTLEVNGPAYWLVSPDDRRALILLRMESTPVADFKAYAQAIVEALNNRESDHDK